MKSLQGNQTVWEEGNPKDVTDGKPQKHQELQKRLTQTHTAPRAGRGVCPHRPHVRAVHGAMHGLVLQQGGRERKIKAQLEKPSCS